MSVYDELGLPRVINASATLTRLGGSRMPPPVVAAMAAAAESFVDLDQMQERVGARIAELTGNEACYVSSGAAAGIVVAVAACIAGTDPALTFAFPDLEGVERTEVVIHHSQRNGYDYAARQTGAQMVEIDGTTDSLVGVLSSRTACVLWFAGANFAKDALPIEEVVRIAREHAVPVLVDAAAQIPPIANLGHFTRELGADAAIFSGGKGLRGPQSSGLVLGTKEIVAGCRANGNPNHSLGRPMKVGKEELAGILAAVEWSLAQDEPALLARYEATVQRWLDGLADIPGVTAERVYPSEAGQPHGRAIVHVGPPCPLDRDQVVAGLWDGNPCIAVATSRLSDDAIALNPQTLEPGEDEVVLAALRRTLTTGTGAG
ncbi:MAG TPA: aminotransferase class V-fold PLP-dependent enzyme [Thermomicrobiales bacterium]